MLLFVFLFEIVYTIFVCLRRNKIETFDQVMLVVGLAGAIITGSSIHVMDAGIEVYHCGDTAMYFNEERAELTLLTHGSKDGTFCFYKNTSPAQAVDTVLMEMDSNMLDTDFQVEHVTVVCYYPGNHKPGYSELTKAPVSLFSDARNMCVAEKFLLGQYLVAYDSPVFGIFDAVQGHGLYKACNKAFVKAQAFLHRHRLMGVPKSLDLLFPRETAEFLKRF